MSEMNHDDLNQLVQELRDSKPAAPLPPAEFTADLRRQLLDQHAGKRRLRFDFDLLRSMAGSVAAFIVLGVAVFVAWFAFSRGQAGVDTLQQVGDWQPAAGEDRAWLISAMPPPGTNLSILSIRPIRFTLEIGYELATAPEALLLVELVPAEEAEGAEGNGPPLARYGSSQWLPITGPEGRVTVEVTTSDLLPEQVTPDIVPQVSFRLPGPETTDVFYQQTLDNARWIWSDETGTASSSNTVDRVWLISIHQAARATPGAPIEFEVVVGYELVSASEAVIKLHYAAPDWETRQVNGRVPMDGMSDFVPVTANENSVTFEFTGSPQEMAQIVGTENPIPVIQLGNFVEHDDGRGRELQLYAIETFAGYPFSLATTEEIRYTGEAATRQPATPEPGSDHLAFVSVWPPTSTVITGTTSTTFEVQLHYRLETLPEAEILVWMMPAGGGASLVVAGEEITAGEGEITLSFSFNPRLDLYAGEASDWQMFAEMGTFGESGGNSLAGASPHDSLEDVWRYEP